MKATKVNNSKTSGSLSYKVEAKVAISEEKVGIEKRSPGRFVLATNLLGNEELTGDEMLSKYQEQQSVKVLVSSKTRCF